MECLDKWLYVMLLRCFIDVLIVRYVILVIFGILYKLSNLFNWWLILMDLYFDMFFNFFFICFFNLLIVVFMFIFYDIIIIYINIICKKLKFFEVLRLFIIFKF